jgi:hypothetical protein
MAIYSSDKPPAVATKLGQAFLCAECECVYSADGKSNNCPNCGSSVGLNLARVLNREQEDVLPFALPTPLKVRVQNPKLPEQSYEVLVKSSMVTREDDVTYITFSRRGITWAT